MILEFTEPVNCTAVSADSKSVNDPRLINFDGKEWLSDVCTTFFLSSWLVNAVFRDLRAVGVYPIQQGTVTFIHPPAAPGIYAPSYMTHTPPTAPGVYAPSPAIHTPSTISGVYTPSPAIHTPSTAPGVYAPSPGVYAPSPAIHTPSTAPGVYAPSPAIHTPDTPSLSMCLQDKSENWWPSVVCL